MPATSSRALPAKVVSGEWLSTMNLTEPRRRLDLRLLAAPRQPAGRGSPTASSGSQKIFISGGDQT